MCRSIKVLRGDEDASDQEVHEASLQFVRKISGYRQPSKANREVFDEAVEEIEAASRRLSRVWSPAPSPKTSASPPEYLQPGRVAPAAFEPAFISGA